MDKKALLIMKIWWMIYVIDIDDVQNTITYHQNLKLSTNIETMWTSTTHLLEDRTRKQIAVQ